MKFKFAVLAVSAVILGSAGAAAAAPSNGAFVIDITPTTGPAISFSVNGNGLNISYPGGAGQTWSNQTATSFGGWADLPQTGGAFTGDQVLFGESSLGNGANVATTTPFYTTGAATYPSGGHTFDSVAFQAGTYTLAGGGSLTVTPAPEPGVWALMIAGLAMVGGALRLRRRPSGAVAA